MRFEHSGNGPRYARRLRTDYAFATELAICSDVHVARCRQWRDFAVVERGDTTIGHANNHVAATAKVTCLGVRNRQSKAGGNRCIDSIATFLHYLRANLGSDTTVAVDVLRAGEGVERSCRRIDCEADRLQSLHQQIASATVFFATRCKFGFRRIQGLQCSPLVRSSDAVRRIEHHLLDAAHPRLQRDRVAHTPTRHRVGLREGKAGDGALHHAG